MKVTQERQAKSKANVLAKLTKVVATQQSNVGSCNMKSKVFLLPEVVNKLVHNVDDDLPVKMEPQIKVCYFQFPFSSYNHYNS